MRQRLSIAGLALWARIGCAPVSIDSGTSTLAEPSLPTIRRQTVVYSLVAKSLAELVAEHRALVARREAPEYLGYTEWSVAFTPSSGRGAHTACAVEPVALVVTVTTTLPRAVNSDQFSPSDSAQWHTFLPALARHEARHDSVIVSEAFAFLRQMETEGNGGLVTKSISQCVGELRARIDRAAGVLDQITQHGRTDGAVLVLAPP